MTREQFISYVENSQEGLRRFLTALCCGDCQLADDIAQETYIKAYIAIATISNTQKFEAWLRRIAYTTFLNHRRVERASTDMEEAECMPAHDRTDSAFDYEGLYRALDLLPPKERTSVLLYYMEGYSIKEVAEIESTGVDAVKQHLSRGRRHLRGLLTEE